MSRDPSESIASPPTVKIVEPVHGLFVGHWLRIQVFLDPSSETVKLSAHATPVSGGSTVTGKPVKPSRPFDRAFEFPNVPKKEWLNVVVRATDATGTTASDVRRLIFIRGRHLRASDKGAPDGSEFWSEDIFFTLDDPGPSDHRPRASVEARGVIMPQYERDYLTAQIERLSDNIVLPGFPSHVTQSVYNYRFLFFLDNSWDNKEAKITVRHVWSPSPPDQEVTFTVDP